MTEINNAVERAAQTADETAGGSVGIAERGHDAVRDHFSDYLDGSLSLSDREQVETHVGECAECSAELATLRETALLMGALPAQTAPATAKEEILRKARSGLASPSQP